MPFPLVPISDGMACLHLNFHLTLREKAKMKVFLTGATGILGKRVAKVLKDGGHDPFALSRSDANELQIREQGIRPVAGNLFSKEDMLKATKGFDAVFHLATHIPKIPVPDKPSHWAENDRIRIEGTKNLLHACRENNIRIFMQPSITVLYGDLKGAWVDENTNVDPYPIMMVKSAHEMEQMIRKEKNVGHVILRFGTFYAPDAYNTHHLIEQVMKRKIPVIGKGKNYLNFIHADDAADALCFAFEHFKELENKTIDVTDFSPVTSGEFLVRLAQYAGVKKPYSVPLFLLKLMLNRDIYKYLTHSYRVKKPGGLALWEPKHPNPLEGFKQIVDQINDGIMQH
jgi:2-alkyl-3-oxoalkanoate reductase